MADPQQANESQANKLRTPLLAGVAVTLIGLLAADTLLNQEAGTPANTAASKTSQAPKEAPLLGAPPKAGVKELTKRYATVLKAGPFTKRSFRPKPKPRPRPRRTRREPERRPEPPKPTGPQPIKVRWTGVIGEGKAASAVLEERATGRGLFATPGQKVGEVAFLSVAPETLVVETKGKKKTLALGDALELPPNAKDELTKLGPPAPEPGSTKSSSSYKPKVKLTKDRRAAILERLRARRRASMEKKKAEAKKKADAAKNAPKKDGK